MSEFLWLHKLPFGIRGHISSYMERCDVPVLGYREAQHSMLLPLLTVGEYLKTSGIMRLLMLDRSVEEFMRFELKLVSPFTPHHELDMRSVWIGRTVTRLVNFHDFLVCLEPGNMLWVKEIFTPSKYGKRGYPVHVERMRQRFPRLEVERPLAPPPDGREVELRSLTKKKIETVPLLQAIIRGHWTRAKVGVREAVEPSFKKVRRSPGERYI